MFGCFLVLPCQMLWRGTVLCSCCKQILTWAENIKLVINYRELDFLITEHKESAHHSSKDTAPSPFSSMAANWSLPWRGNYNINLRLLWISPEPFQNSNPNFWGKAAAALIIPLKKYFNFQYINMYSGSIPSNSPSSTLPSKSLSAEMKALTTNFCIKILNINCFIGKYLVIVNL